MTNLPSVDKLLVEHSKTLYLFFGGISHEIVVSPFEFYNASKIMHENKIFLRDLNQAWYHAGLCGISRDIDTTAAFIQTEISRLNPEKIFFVGNSMGGYAALLFAMLLKQGDVIAFVPQTFICPILRKRFSDNRWSQPISNTYRIAAGKRCIFDVKPLIAGSNNQKISLFVSRGDRLDCLHTERLKGMANVFLYEFNGGGHGLIRLLRDQGKLPEIMSGNYCG